ncbi:MAG TPA: sulfite exporter TauE/SafE family protein [Ramlibacter sp.]|nr:sulfite exporter TauE/SafE family protein [Ramlibacter sp.]
MWSTLAFTALLMGLAGGPHCAAMCGAACAGVTRIGRGSARRSMASFQAGRLVGYAATGAVVAGAVQGFAWLGTQADVLRPVWMVFHLAVLAWGLTLLALARQPAWAQQAGLAVWRRVRPLVQRAGGVFGAGALWTFMPCGLLYSALLVASLSGGPLEGAFSMALFAAGSSLSLVVGPSLLARIRTAGNRMRQDWGTRVAGGLLATTALFALWMDLAERIAIWCR